jgi:hypothetical protein
MLVMDYKMLLKKKSFLPRKTADELIAQVS